LSQQNGIQSERSHKKLQYFVRFEAILNRPPQRHGVCGYLIVRHYLVPWRLRQLIPSKPSDLSTKLHDATS